MLHDKEENDVDKVTDEKATINNFTTNNKAMDKIMNEITNQNKNNL